MLTSVSMQHTLTEILKQRIAQWPGSLRQLALRAGVPGPALVYFVNGQRSLHLTTVDKLLPILAIEVKAPKSRKAPAPPPPVVEPPTGRLGAALKRARQIAEQRPARRRSVR